MKQRLGFALIALVLLAIAWLAYRSAQRTATPETETVAEAQTPAEAKAGSKPQDTAYRQVMEKLPEPGETSPLLQSAGNKLFSLEPTPLKPSGAPIGVKKTSTELSLSITLSLIENVKRVIERNESDRDHPNYQETADGLASTLAKLEEEYGEELERHQAAEAERQATEAERQAWLESLNPKERRKQEMKQEILDLRDELSDAISHRESEKDTDFLDRVWDLDYQASIREGRPLDLEILLQSAEYTSRADSPEDVKRVRNALLEVDIQDPDKIVIVAEHLRERREWAQRQLDEGNPENPQWLADHIEWIESAAETMRVSLDSSDEDWLADWQVFMADIYASPSEE
ncbi:MAG: hypothetical protein M2R45_02613 [Verrucomicrobia subdivision 3 bacterium]|nr:hypothetical protein [Limisphaerales bacterium]MCS1416419.1 hypothetical protein [Limisphaerales bacterium]